MKSELKSDAKQDVKLEIKQDVKPEIIMIEDPKPKKKESQQK